MNADSNITTLQPDTDYTDGIPPSENPFVGLRPFEANESFLFFGREKQTTELLQKLHTTRFIGVVGSSGCGKSSLIKASLIPKLKAGFLTEERANWIIASMRPGGHPLHFLAEAYNEALQTSCLPEQSQYRQRLVTYDEIKEKSITELLELIMPVLEETNCNLLLLVDQFEELFTSGRKNISTEEQKNENIIFINLLLKLAKQRKLPIYIIITMRSDYIGRCNQFYGLPEILNESQYLVPRLNRQQLREVIEFPIKLYGQKMSPRLLDLLLNDSDKDLDQLPVLQHCLMRTYKNWLDSGNGEMIDFVHYEKAGKLDHAISQHAREIYEPLPDRQKEIAKWVFKTITDVNAENDPIRRRQTFGDLVAVCSSLEGITSHDVKALINQFRSPDCAFLTPFTGPIEQDTFIDITHESLMRQWNELMKWMHEEQNAGRKFKWLAECVTREPLRGIDLKDAQEWKRRQKPNSAWASRYAGNFDAVVSYIEKSERKHRTNQLIKGSLLLMLILFSAWAYSMIKGNKEAKLNQQLTLAQKEKSEKEAEITRQNLIATQHEARDREEREKLTQKQKELTDSLYNELGKTFKREQLKSRKLEIQKTELSRKTAELQKQNKLIEAYAKQINEKFTELRIVNSNFFKSYKIDTIQKNRGRKLLLSYLDDESQLNSTLRSLNQMAKALDTAEADPQTAVQMAKEVWDTDANAIVQDLSLNLINKNLFPSKKLTIGEGNSYLTSFAISNDRKRFVVNAGTGAVKGTYSENHSLELSKPGKLSVLDTNINSAVKDNLTLPHLDIKYLTITILNEVLGIKKNKLVRWADNKIDVIANVPGDSTTFYRISPDGTLLATYSKSVGARLWKVADLKNETATPHKLSADNQVIYSIAFSSDSKQIALGHANGATLFDSKGNPVDSLLKTNYSADKDKPAKPEGKYTEKDELENMVRTLNFSNNGRKIVMGTFGGKLVIWEIPTRTTQLILLNKEANFNVIGWAVLSPDERKVLAISNDGRKAVYYDLDGNPNRIKWLANSKNNLYYGTFLDNSTLLSVDWYGGLHLWKNHPSFSNLNDAFATVLVQSMTADTRFEEDSSYFRDAVVSSIRSEIDTAADYFYDLSLSTYDKSRMKDYSTKARSLYQKLLNISSGDERYVSKLISLNENLNSIETGNINPDYKQVVERLQENVELRKRQFQKNSTKKHLRHNLANELNDLAYYKLFIHDFKGAIQSALEGLSIEPEYDILYTNLALGFLLNNEFDKAKELYIKYNGKSMNYDNGLFKDGFLQDFEDLEAAGVITPNNLVTYSNVSKIKSLLRKK